MATPDGYHVFTSSGEHHTQLDGHSVDCFARGPGDTWLAIVDRREVRRHAADGSWVTLATADVDLSSLLAVAGTVFAGTYDARLHRLDGERLVPVESFDRVAKRHEWHQVGVALNVRSMSATSDERVVLANVHVGGIQRSIDLGASWKPTIDVDHDVHEVLAHPSRPEVVMAAAAVGLCASYDGGATWTVARDGLPSTYARSVAFLDDEVLLGVSDGPRATWAAIYRTPVAGGAFERVDDGLGDHLTDNVDTRCLAVGKGQAALATRAGDVWVSETGAKCWERVATGLPPPAGVVIA